MSSVKIILAGVLAGVGMLLFGVLFSIIASPVYSANIDLWKPTGGFWYLGVVLLFMLSGLIYALIYTTLGKGMKGGALDKGLLYGSLLWFVGPLPSALLVHTVANIPTEITVGWIFGGLVCNLIAGVTVVFVFTELKKR